jgi:hypothetical protein
VWFKVAETGKTADGKWAATDLLTASNSIYTFTVPTNLKPGQYIIRHEMYVSVVFSKSPSFIHFHFRIALHTGLSLDKFFRICWLRMVKHTHILEPNFILVVFRCRWLVQERHFQFHSCLSLVPTRPQRQALYSTYTPVAQFQSMIIHYPSSANSCVLDTSSYPIPGPPV